MGAIDTEAKAYLSDKKRFADAFNFSVYDGDEVIRADDLKATKMQVGWRGTADSNEWILIRQALSKRLRERTFQSRKESRSICGQVGKTG